MDRPLTSAALAASISVSSVSAAWATQTPEAARAAARPGLENQQAGTPLDRSPTTILVRLAPGTAIDADAGRWRVRDARGGVSPLATQLLHRLPIASVEPLHRGPRAHALLASALGIDRDAVIRLSEPVDTGAIAADLGALTGVFEVAEPVAVGSLCDLAVEGRLPNDPLLSQQYAVANAGQAILGRPGVAGADAGVGDAWQGFAPLREVVVAVIDSGVHPHPDLPALLPGFNVVTQSPDPGDETVSHGTHVAGIIAARHDNGLGVAGVAPWVGLMPVKVTNLFGQAGSDWVAGGIVWAVDHGADVLNVSIGFASGNAALHSAVQYATASGCLVVCSAGNASAGPVLAPASYPEAIAVGATDNRDQAAPFTSTGPELDVCAPGRDVVSTWHQSFNPITFEYRSGTSQAAPVVAGVAALVMMANPMLTPGEVRQVLLLSCEDLGPRGWDPVFGAGRIDAARAVALARGWGSPSSVFGPATSNCRADLDRSGSLSTEDYFLFLEYYVAGDPRADFAQPWGAITGNDFFAYSAEYARGCVGP